MGIEYDIEGAVPDCSAKLEELPKEYSSDESRDTAYGEKIGTESIFT